MEKELGKIKHVAFGFNDRGFLGLQLTFSLNGGSSGIGTEWTVNMSEISKHTQWTENERQENIVDVYWKVNNILEKAKISSIHELKGIPVEVTIDRGMLKEFRVLEEVL